MSFADSVPTDLAANLIFRRDLIQRAQKDAPLRRQLKEACKRDIGFFISAFVWQNNPIKKGLHVGDPFILWPLQERALHKVPNVPWPGDDDDALGEAGLLWCIENEKSLAIEKSREMGASWLCLLVYLWYFLFKPYQKFHCISRNEKAVESSNSDSLFWKLDHVIKHLPDWLLPKGGVRRLKNFFGNDELGCQITGEACTADASIGGRCRSMLMDEFAKIPDADAADIRSGTASTTNCRIFNSTHEGLDTEFFRLCQSPDIFKLRMHWTSHPDKVHGLYVSGHPVKVIDKSFAFPEDFCFVQDGSPAGGYRPGIRSPWYDAKALQIGTGRGVSQELDINPSGSVSQFFEPLAISKLIREFCRPPDWEGDVVYDKETGRGAKLVQQPGGLLKLWILPRADGRLPTARYAAGLDISMGTGASPSTLAMGDCDTGEKIAEYQNSNLYPNEFATWIFALMSLFADESGTPPLVAWEAQGPGNMFKNRFLKLGYRNNWKNNKPQLLGPVKVDVEPGWSPGSSNNNKKILLEDYKTALRSGTFLNLSEVGLADTLAWKYDKNGGVVHAKFKNLDPSGARDNHGDQTIADALCNMCMEQLGISQIKKYEEETPWGSVKWRQMFHKNQVRASGNKWVS